MKVSSDELLKILGGRLVADSRTAPLADLETVSTDSRTVQPGDIFFALVGESFDAHDFLQDVAAAGAQVIVVSKDVPAPGGVAVVQVKDTLTALGDLAAWWRGKNAHVPVLAVVGSSGKTTTKEMLAHIVGASRNLLWTQGNLNNLIGLPHTLFALEPEHEVMVLELGMNVPEENRRLTQIAQPNGLLLTNINHAHCGMFESLDAHFEAEAEPLTAISYECLVILNRDDELSMKAWDRFGGAQKTTHFAVDGPADYRVSEIRQVEPFGYGLTVAGPGGETARLNLPVFGRHNIANAVAALAGAAFLGVSLAEAAQRLESFKPGLSRSEVEQVGGIWVVKDYYNAIPAAVISTLESLADMHVAGRRLVVLGGMNELGEHELKYHREVADAASGAGIDHLLTYAAKGRMIAERALELGQRTTHFDDLPALAESILNEAKPGDLLLIKGSRSLRLEKLFDLIKSALAEA